MGDLMRSEENSQFPSRFIVNGARDCNSNCFMHLDTDVKITLNNENSEKFKLFVPLSIVIMADCSDVCDKNKATLPELTDYIRRISSNWDKLAFKLRPPEWEVEIIDHQYNHPNDVVSKCEAMFKYWMRAIKPASWYRLVQALYSVGLYNVADEITATPIQNVHSIRSASGKALPDEDQSTLEDKEEVLDLDKFIMYLQPILQKDWQYIVLQLLPHCTALCVIKKVKLLIRNGGNKAKIMSTIGNAFLKVKNPFWTEVHRALKEAEYYELAETIKACFLPV